MVQDQLPTSHGNEAYHSSVYTKAMCAPRDAVSWPTNGTCMVCRSGRYPGVCSGQFMELRIGAWSLAMRGNARVCD